VKLAAKEIIVFNDSAETIAVIALAKGVIPAIGTKAMNKVKVSITFNALK